MRKAQHWLRLCSGVGVVAGVSLLLAGEPRATKPAAVTPKSKPALQRLRGAAPIIGLLETRDRIISIKAGPVYTVQTKGGEHLADNIASEKLRADFPELYRLVNGAVAKDGSFVHAGLQPSAR